MLSRGSGLGCRRRRCLREGVESGCSCDGLLGSAQVVLVLEDPRLLLSLVLEEAPLVVERAGPGGVDAGGDLAGDDSLEAEALGYAVVEGARADVGVAAGCVELVDDDLPALGLDGADEVGAGRVSFLPIRRRHSVSNVTT